MSLGKVPGKVVEPRAQEPGAQGNHDNPVSGKHQAPSHCKKQWNHDTYLILTRKGGRAGSEVAKHSQKGKNARENELTSKAEL